MAVMMLATLIPFASVSAQPNPTLAWMGQDWHIEGNGTAMVDGSGNAVIERLSGTADMTLHVNRIMPTDIDDVSWVNQYGTPWVEVTWEDNGEQRGVDVFIDDESHPMNPRVQFGSLFNCEGIAYTKYLAVEEKTVLAGDDCDVPNAAGSRSAGDIHTMYVGKRADGTIDYQFDGVWYTSTLLRDQGITDFEFGDVHLRLRGNDGTTATFRSFTYGDDHDAADVIIGGLPELVEATPIHGSAGVGVRRTLTTLALMIEAFAANDMPGMACLQSRIFDIQVMTQVAKRRIARSDAAVLLNQTSQIRNFLGCGVSV